MATRANILFSGSILYRHWDGYPSGGILADLAAWITGERLIGSEGEDNGRPHYEHTDCVHGDIEWMYVVNVRRQTVRVYERSLRRKPSIFRAVDVREYETDEALRCLLKRDAAAMSQRDMWSAYMVQHSNCADLCAAFEARTGYSLRSPRMVRAETAKDLAWEAERAKRQTPTATPAQPVAAREPTAERASTPQGPRAQKTLTFGERIGQSARDRAVGRAAPKDGGAFEAVREERSGGIVRYRAYTSPRRAFYQLFATREEAQAKLDTYAAEKSAKRAKTILFRKQYAIQPRCAGDTRKHVEIGEWYLTHSDYRASFPKLAGPFASYTEACEHKAAHLPELLRWRPADPKRVPVALDLRGARIEPAELLARFGLRGLEFGVWEQARIGALAKLTADALAALARVLGMDESALAMAGGSSVGSLALALGARGHGNAAAHYEPTRNVINLTKPSGAGCLAHEYGHAVDWHYRLAEPKRLDPVRRAIHQCPNWLAESAKADEGRAKPYFRKTEELIARSFEAWVATLTNNAFLVSLRGMESVMPQGAELARMSDAWSAVFPSAVRSEQAQAVCP